MKQRFHIKREKNVHLILEWLESLPKETSKGTHAHYIQSFQVVEVINGLATEYVGIVLCECSLNDVTHEMEQFLTIRGSGSFPTGGSLNALGAKEESVAAY